MIDSLVKLRYLSFQIINIIQHFIPKYSDRRTDGYLGGIIYNSCQFISSLPRSFSVVVFFFETLVFALVVLAV